MDPALSKVQLVPGATDSSVTVVIDREDHTMGNGLRYCLMRDPDVLFCGYSMPHPSENRINIRLQTRPGVVATDAFMKGLDLFINIFTHIGSVVAEAVERGPEEIGEGGVPGAAAHPAKAAVKKSKKKAAAAAK